MRKLAVLLLCCFSGAFGWASQSIIQYPNILIGWDESFSEVVCYYDTGEGVVEAARLDLTEELDIVKGSEGRWSARLGVSGDGTDIGLSRAFSQRWGAYLGARRDNNSSLAAGIEIHW